MKNIIYLLIAVAILVFMGCSDDEPTTVKYTVASEKVDCMGLGPQKCILLKKEGSEDWESNYDDIKGFTHELGYEYVIEVEEKEIKNPPEDGSSIERILVKQISKIEKNSENLPAGIQIPYDEE